ncbi:MAG: cohesin domain-containing protein, partial [Bacteroidales bacterium]|nr:cohesin domain-containing protein [Bacteroidales bacterium]
MKKSINIIIILFLLMAGRELQSQTIGMRVPDTTSVAGEFIDIPIYADSSLTGEEVYAYVLQLSFNASYLRAESVITTGTIGGSFGDATVNYDNPGNITIAGAGASPLEGTGIFLILRFEVLKPGGLWISFTGEQHNYFNEGDPGMNFKNGYLT